MSVPLEIQLHKEAMLNGHVLILRPIMVIALGGVPEALLYGQLMYHAKGYADDGAPPVRLSYTKLQKQFPFFSRRWIIKIVKKMESEKMIKVARGARVNEYGVISNIFSACNVEATGQESAKMLVFPKLACKVGLLEAIALQQIHIRHHENEGSTWVIRSLNQWHSDVFMYLGLATVKRLFSRLKKQGLIFVDTYQAETGTVNKYRVNYVRVAEVLEIQLPTVIEPENKWSSGWENPLYPKMKKPKKLAKN